MIKFVGVFAVIGLILSVAFGIIGGNRIFSLVLTAVLCSMLSGALGAGTYKVLEQRVPEFLEIFMPQGMGDELELGDEAGYDDDGLDAEGYATSEQDESVAAAAEDTKQFGDHIIVDKIKIKNEPKLIAEAIKTMLAKDDA
ncbi:MAG: hypothetical protein NXI24_03905 [bacterium]|nr:hypothetical protein [bacterium]